MPINFRHAAAALALVAGAGAAHAQTVITREVTTEPVETIIQRGPDGTVITRRPLEMTVPRLPVTLSPQTTVAAPVETISESRETTGLSTTVRKQETVAPPRMRAVAPRQRVSTTAGAPAARPAAIRRTVKTVTRVPQRAVPVVRRTRVATPSLTAAQRNTVYRTIVEERTVPRTVITERRVAAPTFFPPPFGAPWAPVRQDVVTERVIAPAAPEPIVRERIVGAPRVVETVGVAPIEAAEEVTERVVTRPVGVALTVGARVPTTVPLYALPPSLALQVPAVRPYRYAIFDERVFLVDPLTNVVVDELDQ